MENDVKDLKILVLLLSNFLRVFLVFLNDIYTGEQTIK
jgi:hypothetical protein